MAWLPLAEENPVPGNPWGLLEFAGYLADRAEALHDLVQDLGGLAAEEIWDGEAAKAFADRRGRLVPRLELLAARYEESCRALRRYAPALETAQEAAQDALRSARRAEERAGSATRTLQATPENPTDPLDAAQRAELQQQIEGSGAQITLARRLLDDAVALRDQAAGRCYRELGEAIDDQLRNDTGLMAWARRGAKSVVERFPAIKELAERLSAISGALGLLALFPPLAWLGPIAAIAGGVSLVLEATLLLAGEGSWFNFATGVIGLASFGVSRAFTAAARGTAGAAAATEAGSLAARTGPGALRGLTATSESGRRIFGAAARSRNIRVWLAAKTSLGTDAATGMFPSARNWVTAFSRWTLDLPARAILDLSPRAVRHARIAVTLGHLETATDVVDVGQGAAGSIAERIFDDGEEIADHPRSEDRP